MKKGLGGKSERLEQSSKMRSFSFCAVMLLSVVMANLYDHTVQTIDGKEAILAMFGSRINPIHDLQVSLGQFKSKVALVVNVASE